MATDKKFESIGLALSGGGYRAAAFHLGTLGYLNRVGLMDKVNAISTVSGGTFTGTRLVLAQAEDISFQKYYQAFYEDLANIDLVQLAMDNLGKGVSKAPSKRKDLIIAIAQVYADTFMRKGNGETYLLGDVLETKIPIQEATFNATDFRSGLAFRFQKTSSGLIGNYYVDLPKEEAGKIRLADVLAASSCFPGGFEPLEFPDDFVWPDGKVPDGIANAVARGERRLSL